MRTTELCRDAWRSLIRAPRFLAVSVLSISIAYACAAASLSLYWLCFHQPLPFSDPDRVVLITGAALRQHAAKASEIDALPAFDSIAVYRAGFRRLVAATGSVSGIVAAVSPGFFRVLGTETVSRRGVDGTQEHTNVVVLSSDVVRTLCGGLAEEGRCVVRIGGMPHDVVGQIAADPFPADAVAWVPYTSQIVLDNSGRAGEPMGLGPSHVLARLRAQVPLQTARAQVAAFQRTMERGGGAGQSEVGVVALRSALTERSGEVVKVLTVITSLLLVTVGANGFLLLGSRAAQRHIECATRLALGASSSDIVQASAIEGASLIAASCAVGFPIASVVFEMLRMLVPQSLPTVQQAQVHVGSSLVLALLLILTGALTGLVAARVVLRNLGAGSVLDPRPWSHLPAPRAAHAVLLIVVAALTTMLSAAALFLNRNVLRAQALDVGFEPRRLLTATLLPPDDWNDARQDPGARLWAEELTAIVDALRRMPGVMSVGASTQAPLSEGTVAQYFEPDVVPVQPGVITLAVPSYVTAGFRRALGIELVAGEDLPQDTSLARALIDERAAVALWGSASTALNHTVVLEGTSYTIAGVVTPARSLSLSEFWMPQLYLPLPRGAPDRALSLAVRFASEGAIDKVLVGKVVQTISPDAEIRDLQSGYDVVNATLRAKVARAGAAAVIALVAVVVATAGAFGVAVYGVARRLHECAVRAACGATRRKLMLWLAGTTTRASLFGAGIGLLLSNGSEGLLRHLVYSPDGLAPLMRVGVALTVAAVMITATLLALAHAFRDDPVRYLREQ